MVGTQINGFTITHAALVTRGGLGESVYAIMGEREQRSTYDEDWQCEYVVACVRYRAGGSLPTYWDSGTYTLDDDYAAQLFAARAGLEYVHA